jgi:hypothetical protein
MTLNHSTHITEAYDNAIGTTLACWEREIPLRNDESRQKNGLLALTVGSKFSPSAEVSDLIHDLSERASRDPLLHVTPRHGLHFTFFAVTPHLYDEGNLPASDDIAALSESLETSRGFTLHDLRLVVTPNCLLLAGSPPLVALLERERFAEALMSSRWSRLIRRRYGAGRIPPLFWHTTLVRSRSNILPESLQIFFRAHKDKRYPSQRIPPPALHAATYDWSSARRV